MARTDLLPLDHVDPQYLVKLIPSVRPTDFVIFDALNNVFRVAFSFGGGDIIDVSDDGVPLTSASTTALSAGEFFHDTANNFLFIRLLDNTNPNLSFTVVTFEIYLSTFDLHHQRIPTDAVSTTNRVVYWEPFIIRSPLVKQNISDGNIGFLPPSQSTITISNAEQFFEKLTFDVSYNQKDIELYHYVRDTDTVKLTADLFKLVLKGQMGNIRYLQDRITIQVRDRTNIFLKEFRNEDVSFYRKSTFSELDPQFVGRPIRYVYGLVDGFVPVNLDFNDDSETVSTSDNRVWGVRTDKANTHEVSFTIAGGSTTTVIELGVAPTGFTVGDTVKIDKTTDEFREISVVGATSITVAPALVSGAPVDGDIVSRGTIARIVITQMETNFVALFDRDYTINTGLSDDVLGFTFRTSLEANLGMAETLSPSDRVICKIYGKKNNVTLGGPGFGTNDTTTGNLTAPAVILFDILKRFLGLSESEINTASFTTLQAATTEAVSLAIADKSQSDFPNFQEIIENFIKTLLIKVIFDDDNLLEVQKYAPQSSSDFTLEDIDIQENQVEYQFDYEDLISDVLVKFNFKEFDENLKNLATVSDTVVATNLLSKFLHGIDRQIVQQSLHLNEVDAQKLADRLAFIFGDRQGRFSINSNRVFFDRVLGDKVKVSRTKLPGFTFDEDTVRERDFTVIGVDKTLNGVTLLLDDQKGANDNSGSF